MSADRIRGESIRWTFTDGPMANTTFDHMFHADGTVTWRELGVDALKPTEPGVAPLVHYQSATVRPNVSLVSYLVGGGFTLSVILDFETGHIVALSSNEEGVHLQHGTFTVGKPAVTDGHSSTPTLQTSAEQVRGLGRTSGM